MVAVAGDVVGLLYISAPAVDTADTTDCAKHRDAGAAGVGQFRNMLRRLDFLGRVGQGAEGERLTGLFQGQFAAVCQLHPVTWWRI